jgi:phosphoglycolate phosphatase-like HAD superfamily hydrolase
MPALRTDALVFDFDGVLVESNDVKTRAFAEIYRGYGGNIADQAVAYHLEHEGISRYLKFRHLHRTLLGVELSDADVAALGEQFSGIVLAAVIAAPLVKGAHEFLETFSAQLPLFVASGTPDHELKTIIAQRGMARYFRSTHGTPATKGAIIRTIIASHGFDPARVLMVGDATADLAGANEAGVRFVGRVAAGRNPFPPGTAIIPDLVGLAAKLTNQVG